MVINPGNMKAKMKNTFLAAVFYICLASGASADLAQRIDSVIRQPSQKKVQFSIRIAKADSGRIVYSHNPNRAMIPASNMKIVATAAALKYLGPDHLYKTRVGLSGDTLVVIGSGDPLLGDKATDAKYDRQTGWILEDITTALRKKGVVDINDIIVDSSIFDDRRVHPNWPKEQLNRWYACEVSGINYNGNCINLTTDNVGGKIVISVEPETDFIKIINKVVPIKRGKGAVGAYRTPQPNKIILKGKCKKQQGPFAVAVERPAMFFACLLAENARKAGLNIEGRLLEQPLSDDRKIEILREYTHSMGDCLARCNKDSFGLAAEALLKTIAAQVQNSRKNGSWETGRAVISAYLRSLGVAPSEFYIDDASGLSRHNRLSANAITKVLLYVYRSPDWPLFKESLAVGGIDGTIRRYFREDKYKAKIFGKTGYISGVKSFSGICTASGGDDYIFAILANKSNGKTRKAVNDIVKAIIDAQ
ncbi:MAG: D-alanyl-D-alanine carboxypeptidase/D-alanyl-D-alanine endopeptidase [Planctomycetota bacterium]